MDRSIFGDKVRIRIDELSPRPSRLSATELEAVFGGGNSTLLSMMGQQYKSGTETIDKNLKAYVTRKDLREEDLLRINQMASRFNSTNLFATNLVKGLSDTQKGIAQKM